MAGGRTLQHSWFREVLRQISSPFVLPFARCQPMNSVCLGRRAHRYTCTRMYRALSKACISIGIRSSFFPEGVLGLMLGEQPGKDGKMKSMLKSKVIRANVCDVKTPTALYLAKLSRPFSRIVINL